MMKVAYSVWEYGSGVVFIIFNLFFNTMIQIKM